MFSQRTKVDFFRLVLKIANGASLKHQYLIWSRCHQILARFFWRLRDLFGFVIVINKFLTFYIAILIAFKLNAIDFHSMWDKIEWIGISFLDIPRASETSSNWKSTWNNIWDLHRSFYSSIIHKIPVSLVADNENVRQWMKISHTRWLFAFLENGKRRSHRPSFYSYSHKWPHRGHFEWFENHSFICIKWPPCEHPWHHAYIPFTIRLQTLHLELCKDLHFVQ